MTLSATDKIFLKGLKDEGVGMEEAFSRLRKAKSQLQAASEEASKPVKPGEGSRGATASFGETPKVETVNEAKKPRGLTEKVNDKLSGLPIPNLQQTGEFAGGALKSLVKTGSAPAKAVDALNPLGKLADAAFEKAVPGTRAKAEAFDEKQEAKLEPKTGAEEVGATVSEVAQFLLPGAAVKAIPNASKALKGVSVAQKALFEGGTAAGIAAAQEGEIGAEAALAGATGAAFPLAGAGLKKAFSPERLIGKALGLTPTQTKNIDKIAKTKSPNGKPIYENVEDFALKNDFKGSRDAMVDQAEDLLTNSFESKEEILQAVKELTPNTYSKAFEHLKKAYNKTGLDEELNEIVKLSNKPELTAVELDKVRRYLDGSMGIAYTGSEKLTTKGIQNITDPIRRTLEKLDKTGEIRKTNTDIRILTKLVGSGQGNDVLRTAAQRSLVNQLTFRGGLAGGVAAGATAINPALGAAIGAIGFGENILLSFPQVSSTLAQNIKNMPRPKAAKLLEELVKAVAKESATSLNSN